MNDHVSCWRWHWNAKKKFTAQTLCIFYKRMMLVSASASQSGNLFWSFEGFTTQQEFGNSLEYFTVAFTYCTVAGCCVKSRTPTLKFCFVTANLCLQWTTCLYDKNPNLGHSERVEWTTFYWIEFCRIEFVKFLCYLRTVHMKGKLAKMSIYFASFTNYGKLCN